MYSAVTWDDVFEVGPRTCKVAMKAVDIRVEEAKEDMAAVRVMAANTIGTKESMIARRHRLISDTQCKLFGATAIFCAYPGRCRW